jgi:hypothetical protein
MVDLTQDLLGLGADRLLELGKAAHSWSAHRLSDREAFNYMLGSAGVVGLPVLPEPWDRLKAYRVVR